MSAANSKLEGILRWSLQQSDGTAPSRQISDEERKWFQEAIGTQLVDIVQRMKEISSVMAVGEAKLLEQGVTVDELASMLEELQEHVESIDMANDLKAIGGLPPLLLFLKSPHAVLRARAAEVVMTMVQNNDRSQQNVMQAGGLVLLCDVFMNDDDVVARTKACGALSSLIRHNFDGLASFHAICGVKHIMGALSVDDNKLRRKLVNLLKYILEEFPMDKKPAVEAGAAEAIQALLKSDELDIRLGAIDVLVVLSTEVVKFQEKRRELEGAVKLRIGECERIRLSGDSDTQADMVDEIDALRKLESALFKASVASAEQEKAPAPPLLLGAPPR